VPLSLNHARMGAVKPSATLEMAKKARELNASGTDVANLSAGEPDYPTPSCILDEVRRVLPERTYHSYTPARGLPELVSAMQEKFKRDQGVDYAESEVISTIGTKGGLSLAIDALIGEGDEVIIISPFWVTYPDLVRLAGGTPVIVETTLEEGFRPSKEKLQAALTPRTKAVILNTPSNPTGASYDENTLRELMAALEGTDVWVLSDEIYERLTYGGFTHVSPAGLSDDARARTLVFGGVAKAYAMTGWRLGVAAGPKLVIDAMLLLQQQRATCATGIAQAAAAYALREPSEVQRAVADMRAEFEKRQGIVLEALAKIEGARVHKPEGAFYVFCDVSSRLPGKNKGGVIADDVELTTRLLADAHVAAVPGTPFGAPGGFRLSYATGEVMLKEGLKRLQRFFAELERA
jgi:aspartate aminotransferase